ncbi:MAG TPA: hypothetical protein VH165_03910 [Kofleriaceae bacterium]|nr:hypothetical protein [Kofleriaceae bacterium]
MIAFTDVDENTLVVRLRDERIQLSVVDSRPELEGGELRGFATALFNTYAAAPLVEQLADARGKLAALRGKLAKLAPEEEEGAALVAGLEDALRSVDAVRRVLSAPVTEARPRKPPPIPDYTPIGRRKRTRRFRASESPGMGWGWRPLPDDDASA